MRVQGPRWLVVTAALLALGSNARSETVALECQMSGGQNLHFILDVAAETAQFVMPNGIVVGTLRTNEHRYELRFPKSEHRWETRVQIERYSGTLAWEHGGAPFGQSSKGNVFRSGKCKKIDSRLKL